MCLTIFSGEQSILAKNGGTNVLAAFGTRITRTNEWLEIINIFFKTLYKTKLRLCKASLCSRVSYSWSCITQVYCLKLDGF